MAKIRLAVCGLGNLGKAAIRNLNAFDDFELVAVVSRRAGSIDGVSVPVVKFDDVESLKGKVDVMLLCGGSATDLPVQTPHLAKNFNVVDSFDNHSQILTHRKNVGRAAAEGGNLAVISVGWDPGLFSIVRSYFNAFLPNGHDYTFWGMGVSQGHSDAVRRISGVKKAVQYTVPKAAALNSVKNGETLNLSAREKHERIVYAVAYEGEDLARIENEIKTMPSYFADYDTTVHFISETEFDRDHTKLPHGGNVFRNGETDGEKQKLELSIKLNSNPLFTSSIMLSYARAAYRLSKEGMSGCLTAFDIAPKYLYREEADEMIGKLL